MVVVKSKKNIFTIYQSVFPNFHDRNIETGLYFVFVSAPAGPTVPVLLASHLLVTVLVVVRGAMECAFRNVGI